MFILIQKPKSFPLRPETFFSREHFLAFSQVFLTLFYCVCLIHQCFKSFKYWSLLQGLVNWLQKWTILPILPSFWWLAVVYSFLQCHNNLMEEAAGVCCCRWCVREEEVTSFRGIHSAGKRLQTCTLISIIQGQFCFLLIQYYVCHPHENIALDLWLRLGMEGHFRGMWNGSLHP